MLALPGDFDARWLAAIDDDLLARLRAVIAPESLEGNGAGAWQV